MALPCRVFHGPADQEQTPVDHSIESSVSTLTSVIEHIDLPQQGEGLRREKARGKGSARWGKREMAGLVDLLRELGSDFEMIAVRMGRSREQVKRKYKILERRYPELAEAIYEETPRKDHHQCYQYHHGHTLGEIEEEGN
jgi:hypothetical protein